MVEEWVPIVTAVGGLVVGGLIKPSIDLIKTRMENRTTRATAAAETQAARDAAAAEDDRARDAQVLAQSESNRELLLRALELSISKDATEVARAWALFEAVSGMTKVSPDDARLCSLLRAQLAGELGGQYLAQLEASGERVVMYVDSDHLEGDDVKEALDQGQASEASETGE